MLRITTSSFLETALWFWETPTWLGQSDFLFSDSKTEMMVTGAEKSCFWVILGSALCRDCPPAHIHHHRSWQALLLALQNLDILFPFWFSELPLISLRNFLVWLSWPELTSVARNQRILADTELLIEYPFFKVIYLWFLWVFVAVSKLLSGCDEEGLLCYGTTSTRQGSAAAARGPYSLGLAAVAHELSYGIFLDQGLNPCSLHWQADSLPLDHQGSHWHRTLFWSVVGL